MKHISEVIVDWMDNIFKLQDSVPDATWHVQPGNMQFWAYVQALFQHPQFQQFQLFKMSIPEDLAAKLSLQHNQMVEIFKKDVIVQFRPNVPEEARQNSFDVAFEPIE